MNTRKQTPWRNMSAAINRKTPRDLLSRLAQAMWRAGGVLREVLRGYCAGQPVDESRPRKGCC
jgi:hypothetical protein